MFIFEFDDEVKKNKSYETSVTRRRNFRLQCLPWTSIHSMYSRFRCVQCWKRFDKINFTKTMMETIQEKNTGIMLETIR
jgi:hypothetical protein